MDEDKQEGQVSRTHATIPVNPQDESVQESPGLCAGKVKKALQRRSLISLPTETGRVIVQHGIGRKANESSGQTVLVQRPRGKRGKGMSEAGRLVLHGWREEGCQEEKSQLTILIGIGSVFHSSFYRLLPLVNPLSLEYQEF